ncbi:MAG: ABC transporter ATP-binding protein [Pseudomonadota bacterium]
MLLNVRDISRTFPGPPPLRVLDGVSLTLDGGETLALTGESGSGKSTLLYIIGGLETPDAGSVEIAGEMITKMSDTALARLRRRAVGVVFQQFNLIPSLTVAQNLTFHARLAGRVDLPWVAEVTDRLGLGDLRSRYPEQLSGGQQQRVAIGRALAARPKLLLADEPTGNLDEDTGDRALALLIDLAKEAGSGLLMVTHSPARAQMLDRQLHLSRGKLA